MEVQRVLWTTETTVPTVFISHSSKDTDFIERNIIPALKANGIDVWYSRESIKTADQWERSINSALESSDWFVVAISPNSVKSKWVRRETGWAFRYREDKIIPVLIGQCNPDDLYTGLPDLQHVDCIGDPKKGADELALLLAQKGAATGKIIDFRRTPPPSPSPWIWIVAIVVVLLTAVPVSRWLWPISNPPNSQQTPSEPDASSQKHDPPEHSVGAPPTGLRNSVSRPTPVVVDTPQEMVPVPAGKFLMGSPTSERDRDPREAQHEVSVDAFWMDPTEVTNAAFQKFLVANAKWQKPQVKPDFVDDDYLKNWKNAEYRFGGHSDYPVTNVSWYAAQAYCTWMNKRLPTEAEWEYAARAGKMTAYWWGDEWAPASAAGNLERGPDPVGKQAHRNPWNLFDMLGNVKEWTSTVYKPYPYDASDGREDPQSISARTVRGGSWADTPEYLRSAARISQVPNFTDGLVGFRCASSTRAN
jgi:sulfatase modifying factor 1